MSKIPQGEWPAIAARSQHGESISKIARSYGCTPPAIHYILKRHRLLPAAADREPTAERAAATPAGDANEASTLPSPDKSPHMVGVPTLVRTRAPVPGPAETPRPLAENPVAEIPVAEIPVAELPVAELPGCAPQTVPTPGLDSELHHRAEAAIEVFRTSFDAAMAEGSPGVREQLRQAAADLMRVAARTTIVLDRVSARAERVMRAPYYPRSAHMHD